MTLLLPWPYVRAPDGTVDPQAAQDNFDAISLNVSPASGLLRLAGTANRSVAVGQAQIAIPASASDAVSGSVAHGLGVVPFVVVATAQDSPDGRDDYVMTTRSRDATNIVFAVRVADAGRFPIAATTITFDWLAIA